MERSREEKQEILNTVFDSAQNWVQLYNSLLVQINGLALGGSSAIVAYFMSLIWGAARPPPEFSYLLLAPVSITGFAIWSTHTLVREIQSAYTRIIRIERYWNLYEKGAIIPDETLYEERYLRSDRDYPDIPKHLMVVQIIVLALTLFVAGLSVTK